MIKDIIKLFRKLKQLKILTDTKDLFQYREQDFGVFGVKILIEYKGKGDRKTLSIEEYLNKTKPYLKDIINVSNKIRHVENSTNNKN